MDGSNEVVLHLVINMAETSFFSQVVYLGHVDGIFCFTKMAKK